MKLNTVTQKSLPSLATLGCGSRGVVGSVTSENPTLCNKLLSMGLVNGTAVEVLAVAPLGDPIKVRALGYDLSLRKSEAQSVLLQAAATA